MKQLIFTTTSMFMLAFLLMSCDSTTNESEMNKHADSNLNETMELSMEEQLKMKADYNDFMQKASEDIKRNEERINQEIANIQKLNITFNNTKGKHIMILKKRNTELHRRLHQYDMKPNDWEKFKTDFNYDMASIGDSFEDLFSED